MRLFGWRSLAVSSMMVGSLAAQAETRPQYGGALHVAMRAAPESLDPAGFDLVELDLTRLGAARNAQADSFARRSLTSLMFDTLVTTNDIGRVQPALATSWQAKPRLALSANQLGNQLGNERWQFRIRGGVKFHDGTALNAESAAASLRAANPSWNVSADGDSVVIERGSDADLLAELALPRNAIAKRNPGNAPSGTGPFHIVDWQPGKKLALAAEEDCWRGRPFLDTIEIEMGKSFRDQMTALQLRKADLVEVAPEQARQFSPSQRFQNQTLQKQVSQNQVSQYQVSHDGRRLASSAPVELLALVFARDAASPEEKLLRQALAWSVERGSIKSVLLQGAGQPAASILPNWMSGYGFVFPTDADLPRARQAREQAHTTATWTLGYDGTDPLDRLLAERIALNARDAGLSVQPTPSSLSVAAADLRLVRIPLASQDPWIALASVAMLAGAPSGKGNGSVEDLYAAELALLATQRLIPLFHLPVSYAAAASLNAWALRPDGSWALDDAWLGTGRP
jgi:peptide/nickel transport system substrate-binding protein